jgi:hypothetical protein
MADPQRPTFDATYYATGCGQPYVRNAFWLADRDRIAQRIVQDIGPTSVMDAGCAMGFLVERLRAHHVDAWGVDISEYAIAQAHDSVKAFCRVGSVADPFGQRFDLIVTIEVLEHMPQPEAERAIANLCAHSNDVLFSSSPDDYAEATHINVQPPEYWVEQFARHGFYADLDFDASFITHWAVRFRKTNAPPQRVAKEYARKLWLLHRENTDLRRATAQLRQQLANAQTQTPSLADIEHLNNQITTLGHERDQMRQRVQAYERGKFMRFMRWLKKTLPSKAGKARD